VAHFRSLKFNALAGLPLLLFLLAAIWILSSPSAAETNLTEFNGEWRGAGTDRNTPLASAQQTRCRMLVRADRDHLNSETTCDGEQGLHKVLHLAIVLNGDRFTGEASQKSALQNNPASETRLSGSVIGHKTDETATLDIHFSGMTPNASVVLRRVNASAFTMQISSLGLTLTDVAFRRASGQ
jgi:hypothetical protein